MAEWSQATVFYHPNGFGFDPLNRQICHFCYVYAPECIKGILHTIHSSYPENELPKLEND